MSERQPGRDTGAMPPGTEGQVPELGFYVTESLEIAGTYARPPRLGSPQRGECYGCEDDE